MLSVLFFQERPGVWVAQALEHDIAAHGGSIDEAKTAFERTVWGYLRLAESRHQTEPFEALQKAPDAFWQAWHRITAKSTEALPTTPPAYVVAAISSEPVCTTQ